MKKYLPYILGTVLAVAVVVMVLTGKNPSKKPVFDDRVTFVRQDKIPYGTYIAYHELQELFPSARIVLSLDEPGYWNDSIRFSEGNQALVIVGSKFNADETEMYRLIRFAKNGNDVFISSRSISSAVANIIGCSVSSYSYKSVESNKIDSLQVGLKSPPYDSNLWYSYPGKQLDSYFDEIDRNTVEVLGTNDVGQPNFIRLRAGKGNFYFHLAPVTFSNYFLLTGNNMDYYAKVLSVISPGVKTVAWDEYYLNKKVEYDDPENSKPKKNWFSALMQLENANGDRSFRAAFWLMIGLLLLYAFQEMRRKQRYIPALPKTRNDSLDFVKTIGRLYYDKGDHKNLAKKMAAYFLEHVRSGYKMLTNDLNDNFIITLHQKSGIPESEIRRIVQFIHFIDNAPAISEQQLVKFYNDLEAFYHKTS